VEAAQAATNASGERLKQLLISALDLDINGLAPFYYGFRRHNRPLQYAAMPEDDKIPFAPNTPVDLPDMARISDRLTPLLSVFITAYLALSQIERERLLSDCPPDTYRRLNSYFNFFYDAAHRTPQTAEFFSFVIVEAYLYALRHDAWTPGVVYITAQCCASLLEFERIDLFYISNEPDPLARDPSQPTSQLDRTVIPRKWYRYVDRDRRYLAPVSRRLTRHYDRSRPLDHPMPIPPLFSRRSICLLQVSYLDFLWVCPDFISNVCPEPRDKQPIETPPAHPIWWPALPSAS
jgi:hypothetical protein